MCNAQETCSESCYCNAGAVLMSSYFAHISPLVQQQGSLKLSIDTISIPAIICSTRYNIYSYTTDILVAKDT